MKSNDELLDDLLNDLDFTMDADDASGDGDSSEQQSLSALAQLMAEMEEENVASEEVTDDVLALSEEELDILLNEAKSPNAEEELSFDINNSDDMAEIEALLNMSDNNVAVDSDEELWKALEALEAGNATGDSKTSVEVAKEEALELSPEELDAILLGNSQGEGKAGKSSKAGDKKNNSEKKGGFFRKIFSLLMEEVPDEDPEEAATLNLSEENKDILKQLDKEKKKKDKKEKKVKAVKEKPKKEKKVKPKKEKKPKEEKPAGKPEKRLPRKGVIVTSLFALSILVAILVIDLLVPSVISLSSARESYNRGEYKEAFQEFYGRKLSEEDQQMYQASTAILRLQGSLDGYHNYTAMNNPIMALHSLLEGIIVKGDIFAKAEAYGVISQVQSIYQEILNILSTEFSLSENGAIELVNEESDVIYTKKLEAIVNGAVYVEENLPVESSDAVVQDEVPQAISQEDLLPEEESFFQEGE